MISLLHEQNILKDSYKLSDYVSKKDVEEEEQVVLLTLIFSSQYCEEKREFDGFVKIPATVYIDDEICEFYRSYIIVPIDTVALKIKPYLAKTFCATVDRFTEICSVGQDRNKELNIKDSLQLYPMDLYTEENKRFPTDYYTYKLYLTSNKHLVEPPPLETKENEWWSYDSD